MKNRILPLLLLLAATLCTAATSSAPVWVASLITIQADPRTGLAEAYFDHTAQVGGVTVAKPGGWQRVAWPLGSGKTITVGDRTMTYAEVMGMVVAIAAQEKAAADAPPPAPEEP